MPYTRIRLHFVFATKGRNPFLTCEVERLLYIELEEIVRRCGGVQIEANGDERHVHLFAGLRPSIAPSTFIGKVKANSSRLIREHFPSLDFRWQEGFGCFTVSVFDQDALRAYIRNQKEHHADGSTRSEWERTA